MISRLALTETVVRIVEELHVNGFRVDIDADNVNADSADLASAEHVEAFDGDIRIYWALRKGLPTETDAWIVRCHPDYFTTNDRREECTRP